MCSATSWPELATARLTLRAPCAADAPRLSELANDFDVARMTTSMPHPFSLADAQDFLRRAGAGDPARERVFIIEAPGEGMVGVVGLHPKPLPHTGAEAPEVGYWVGRPFWGRGYATEAAEAAVDWAHNAWGKRLVTSGHFADNPASGAVLSKAGFLYTGDVQTRFSRARGEDTPTRMMVRLA
jgi:RimJ/RimL family protein N-acetyltransferase